MSFDGPNPYAPPKAQDVPPAEPPALTVAFSYRSLNGPGWFIVVALAAYILLSLGSILNANWGAGLMARIVAGQDVPQADLGAYDTRSELLSNISLAAMAAAGIGFCIFLPRANRNARSFGCQLLTYTPGWSVGVFFVPIWNFYRPYQSVRELWLASAPPEKGPWSAGATPALLPLWWGAWICCNIIGRIVSSNSHGQPTAAELQTRMRAAQFSDLVSIAAAVLCAAVVLGLMRRFEAKAQRLTEAPSSLAGAAS